jgi:ubiquinone/menaquinone biosynthesis C-methylase UbiE
MSMMQRSVESLREENRRNKERYGVTAWFYDLLDAPWERQYRKWRPKLVGDLHGEVLEAGVGTGRNLKYYPSHVSLTALDFSPAMLRHASRRCRDATCSVRLLQDDACDMTTVESDRYDWVVATFLCCVLPAGLQEQAIAQFGRVLKPGGKFRLLEMVYSQDPALRRRQDFFAPFVEKVYGARFDRDTHRHLMNHTGLNVTSQRFIKHDTYLLIEGEKIG